MIADQKNLVAVIMAGGAGTRFWPLSTDERPKQFLRLFGERSLLQMSCDRLVNLFTPERILILTNASLVGLVREQLPDIPADNIIGEPCRRDTAAAICLSALLARARFGNATIITLTADHLIAPVDSFEQALVSAATGAAQSGALYTFGIVPRYPATGFGYIELGGLVQNDDGRKHYEVACFREKPDAATAREYQESGRYLWNSGMFVWTANSIHDEMAAHLPDHVARIEAAIACERTPAWPQALAKAFEPLPRISIDYAIMEKARAVRCLLADFDWNDVGGWLAIRPYLTRDTADNTTRGIIHGHASRDNLVFCEDASEVVVLSGVEKLVVVRSGNRTLIAHQDRCEEVKRVVESLSKR
jgi:mannose-1-phosphate guanylyltransferase